MESPERVDTTLNYLADSPNRPVVYVYPAPPGTPQRTSQSTKHPVQIRNGRHLLPELSLDRQGCVLVHHETAVSDFYDAEEVRRVYYPEVERLVAEATGASDVLVFDHNVRCEERARSGDKRAQMPVRFAHNDYTERSGPQRVRDLVAAPEAERRLENRFAVINVWKPIVGPVQKSPLAVCDARSIQPRDLVPTDLVYRDRKGEVYSMAFNARHRWLYFSSMEQNEVMLIKCFDSANDGRARFTAHSAFDDPTSAPDAPSRESIEVRTLAFFAPDASG